mgnify:CR=1 FL=1
MKGDVERFARRDSLCDPDQVIAAEGEAACGRVSGAAALVLQRDPALDADGIAAVLRFMARMEIDQ